ncbi:hypothetical protein ONE63_008305 [Megalurothrips usitatus]|uniref:Uncharacterized protein n=1 Tax=Megalurothrips usitatus TaxID=439358 RepID=A0AAV7XSA3_9NEOP|nr:hypothetical protein ONE63_008305 [Megalurothrips usitatus]
MLVQAQNQKMQAEFKKPCPLKPVKKASSTTKNSSDENAPSEETKDDSMECKEAGKDIPKTSEERTGQDGDVPKVNFPSQHENQNVAAEVSAGDNTEKLDLAVVKIENASDCAMEVCEGKDVTGTDSSTKENESVKNSETGNAPDPAASSEPSNDKDCKVKEEQSETPPCLKESTSDNVNQVGEDSVCTATTIDDDDDEEDEDLKRLAEADKDINIDPKTYCKLGHFHLLLEDYPKGTILLCDCVFKIQTV